MASFFEKLIGGQTEEPKIKKPAKKAVKLPKSQPRPEPEPEIKVEEEAVEEIMEQVEKVTEKTEKKEPVQVQAKVEPKEPKEKESAKKKTSEDLDDGQLAIDVYQSQEEIIIQSTIGGVKPSDLEITIENGIVNIKGSRQKTETVVEDDYFIKECYWGSFSRQLVLPSEVDSSRSEATLKDGVLTIRIPRVQREKITKLEIK
ncbi:Hsp20/alpha crystallin family protein [Patescibacteria group bacterium]|nr:Hsp20/alpha crystallin family protein [Patescibacteria group bacterium]